MKFTKIEKIDSIEEEIMEILNLNKSIFVQNIKDRESLPDRVEPKTHNLRSMKLKKAREILNITEEKSFEEIRSSYEKHMEISNPFHYRDMNVIQISIMKIQDIQKV